MATKNKTLMTKKSSEMLAEFLKKNNLHKKDFAQMVGVTLSYVYNLIDESIPFSTRSTTLERIATVMDILPEEFKEYKIPQDPILNDESTEFIKNKIKTKKMSTLQFLKSFPRKQRPEIVDILRGATPLPLDWDFVKTIGNVLDADETDMYDLWEKRLKQLLSSAGFNLDSNEQLAREMFNCAEKYIKKSVKITKP